MQLEAADLNSPTSIAYQYQSASIRMHLVHAAEISETFKIKYPKNAGS
jgi:hypothetical protein